MEFKKFTLKPIVSASFLLCMVFSVRAMDNTGQRDVFNVDGIGNSGPATLQVIVDPISGSDVASVTEADHNMRTSMAVTHAWSQLYATYNSQSDPDFHAIWRDIVSTTAGFGITTTWGYYFMTAYSSQSGPSRKMTSHAVGGMAVLVAAAFRFHLQHYIYLYLTAKNPHWSLQARKWAALGVGLTCQAAFSAPFIAWVQSAVIQSYKNDNVRRLLLTNSNFADLPPSHLGKYLRDLRYAFGNAKLQAPDPSKNVEAQIRLPATESCPAQILTIPSQSFDSDSYSIVKSYYYSSIKQNWVLSDQRNINPYLQNGWPVKLINDGDRQYRLTKPGGQNGWTVSWVPQRGLTQASLSKIQTDQPVKIPGELIDIAAGPTRVWGTVANGTIFSCRQPCNGAWEVGAGNAVAVAIGPEFAADGRTTNGQRVMVWVKNRAGVVYKSVENSATTNWVRVSAPWIPPRIVALLNERDPYNDFYTLFKKYDMN